MELKDVRATAASCTLCDLHKGRINPVFDKGEPKSKLMICGMVPAKDENAVGIPFVGRAGQMLDKILDKVGMHNVYVTNLVKCFLAAGKKLDPTWIRTCIPYLSEQISIIDPYVIITLGADATNALLGMPEGTPIGKMRGAYHSFGQTRTKIVPTYHPSYLLRKGGEYSEDFGKVIDDFTLARDTHSSIISEIMNTNRPVFGSYE